MKTKTILLKFLFIVFFICNFTGSLYCQDDSKKDFDAIGFELEQKELLFVLNSASRDSGVIQQFGEPEEKSKWIYWGADDSEHQSWYYRSQGLEIDFVKDDSKTQFVSSVNISIPSNLKTSKGIGIGSTQDEVLNAYRNDINKEESKIDEGMIVAGSVYGGLIFEIKNSKVSSIFIGASAE
ncbi:MAG TPA: hypothetical protein VIL99_17500 [Ignavibacteria bacterium]